MNLLTPLRRRGRHRAHDTTALTADLARARAETQALRRALATATRELREANEARDKTHALATQLAETRAELKRARDENRHLATANTAYAAHLANVHAYRPLPQFVDTEPDGIDVRPLWHALNPHHHA